MVRAARAFSLAFLAAGAGAQQTGHDLSGHDHAGIQGQDMPGMQMWVSTPDWMPSPHEGSGTAWQPALVSGPRVDGLQQRLGHYGARRRLRYIQPAGRTPWRGQSRVW